jgi:uncharacterized GH25 family protein
MKKLLLLGGLLSCTAPIPGHEFWLQPERFIVNPGEPVKTHLYAGANYEGGNWSGGTANVTTLRLYYANVTDDLHKQLSATTASDPLQIAVFEEGTILFACIARDSDSANTGDYELNAKTMVQVGRKYTNTFRRQTLLPLDFIPEEHPYKLNDAEKLKVKLYFQKKPLAGATIQLWHRNNEQTVKRELVTDDKGLVEFPVFTTGRWMLSAVKDKFKGTLTWGYVK